MVGAVLLAAGASTRFGADKQLAIFQGATLLRRAAETLTAAAVGPCVAVLGPRADRHRQELVGLPLAVAVNEEAAEGMSSSLVAGLTYLQTLNVSGQDAYGPDVPEEALSAQAVSAQAVSAYMEALLVMVCDQPYCTAEHLCALITAWRQTGKAITASRYSGILGVPAVFDRSMFDSLRALSGTRGAAHLIRENAGEVAVVKFPGGAMDIDTQADLQRLRRIR